MISPADEFTRPSSMAPIELCPLRPTMEAAACALVPALRDMASEPARQGSMGHAVLEGAVADGFAGDWSQLTAVLISIEQRMLGLAGWTKDGVRRCLAYVCEVIRQHSGRYAQVEILTEVKLAGDGIDIPRGGSADLVLLCRDYQGSTVLAVVLDYKLGFVSQGDAADHLQLACYACMAWDRWGPLHGVVVHLAAGRRGEFSSALYDAAAAAGARRRIRAAVAACRAAGAICRPILAACRHCRALCFCHAVRSFIMTEIDQLRLFGADPSDRIRLADAAALAKRFAAEADALAKHWRAQEAEQAGASFTDNTQAAPPAGKKE